MMKLVLLDAKKEKTGLEFTGMLRVDGTLLCMWERDASPKTFPSTQSPESSAVLESVLSLMPSNVEAVSVE